jgi:hypothetical protein
MRRSADRHRIAWTALPAALLLVAWDASGGSLFAPFETRCAELPASRFEVVAVPISYRVVETDSVAQLTVRSGKSPDTHWTFGLTTVNFGHQTQIGIRSIEDAAGHRACGTLEVRVRLSMQPVVIYLANELDSSRCARDVTMEHEQKHLAVFREALDATTRELAANLGAAIGTGQQRAASKTELEQQVTGRINAYLADFVRQRREELEIRQEAIDSPQEYARVRHACGD